MEASQQQVTLVSKRDGRGQAYLDTTRLVTDFGTFEFKHGQCVGVPADAAARAIESFEHIYVMEWGLAGVTPNAPTPTQAPGAVGHSRPVDVPEQTPEEQAAALAEHLAQEGEPVSEDLAPLPPGEQLDATTGSEPPPGERAPGQVKVIPQGFEAFTADEQPRCLAAKADGTQCANVAKEGTSACGLGPHQELVAGLPDAATAA